MLSILVPTYNDDVTTLVQNLRQQCIEEKMDFEIIVADDHSTAPATIERNKSITAYDFCEFIQNEKNLGRTATRSLLAKKAKYNSLLFLDSDVIPVKEDYIKQFKSVGFQDHQVIYGGVKYKEIKPEKNQILRWAYGRKREAKSVLERLKTPYFIISQNLLIKKEIFLKANSIVKNAYGLDNLFSNNLKKMNIPITHIDNPVYHLGLENSSIFINKSLESIKTTVELENQSLMDEELRPLQKMYTNLKILRVLGMVNLFIDTFEGPILKNLKSKKPNLVLFDLFRLRHYSKLKEQ